MGNTASAWTMKEINRDLGKEGFVAVVTGGSSGVGEQAVKELLRLGATVTFTGRTQARLAAAVERITRDLLIGEDSKPAVRLAGGQLTAMVCDQSSQADCRRFVDSYLARRGDRLDLLLNNAGVMALSPRRESADGFELQIATNHLGHFLLTSLLMPVLLRTPNSRVVNTASEAHRWGWDRDGVDLGCAFYCGESTTPGYNPWFQYHRSKMSNMMFTRSLQHRLARTPGHTCRCLAAHPGVAYTDLLGRSGSLPHFVLPIMDHALAMTPAMACLSLLRAALDEEVRGADYVGPEGSLLFGLLPRMYGLPAVQTKVVDKRALNNKVCEQLWAASEEATGANWAAAFAGFGVPATAAAAAAVASAGE